MSKFIEVTAMMLPGTSYEKYCINLDTIVRVTDNVSETNVYFVDGSSMRVKVGYAQFCNLVSALHIR